MRILNFIILVSFIFSAKYGESQELPLFKGQLSLFSHFNPGNELPWWSGIRYIPRLNYEVQLSESRRVDFEASTNIYGNLGIKNFNEYGTNGRIKPYRLWARFYTRQFELRAGLQKINFGSASLLRPLMWFDQVDPRDPLQLTDGVWSVLGRYYFLNNVNIWLWGLYGNKNPKGWELIPTTKNVPEGGGRLQIPVGSGEAAFTYHHRRADGRSVFEPATELERIPENRFGIDARFDRILGYWFEATWKNMKKKAGLLTNQEILNIGADYTINVGNGLTIIMEQLAAAYGVKPFAFDENVTFSLLNVSYPTGLFDRINYIIYYDWKNGNAYNFINWQKQFDHFTIYVMGYINPKQYNIPLQYSENILFAGKGLQLLFVFNH
jgi:hypothetical protein